MDEILKGTVSKITWITFCAILFESFFIDE